MDDTKRWWPYSHEYIENLLEPWGRDGDEVRDPCEGCGHETAEWVMEDCICDPERRIWWLTTEMSQLECRRDKSLIIFNGMNVEECIKVIKEEIQRINDEQLAKKVLDI